MTKRTDGKSDKPFTLTRTGNFFVVKHCCVLSGVVTAKMAAKCANVAVPRMHHDNPMVQCNKQIYGIFSVKLSCDTITVGDRKKYGK